MENLPSWFDIIVITSTEIECNVLSVVIYVGQAFVPQPPLVSHARACLSPPSEEKRNTLTCKFWVNTGRCHKGDHCVHRHDTCAMELKNVRKAWLEDRLYSKHIEAHQEDDPWDPHGKRAISMHLCHEKPYSQCLATLFFHSTKKSCLVPIGLHDWVKSIQGMTVWIDRSTR